MNYPSFFDEVKSIKVQDDLADFLGAYEEGIYEITYKEVVNLAGHSCPTVAGAYLMCAKALKSLYENEVAKRGQIKVRFADSKNNGVSGVIARVISQITGACGDDGFGGIGSNFNRKNLLFFDADISGEIEFTRIDNGKKVIVSLDLRNVPPNQNQGILLQKIIQKVASNEEIVEFKKLWQARVKKILIDELDNLEIVKISKPI